MSRQTPGIIKTFPADSAIGQYLGVVASAVNAGNVALPAGATTLGFIGATWEAADANNYIAVQLSGIAKMIAGGAITAGATVVLNAAGQAVAAVPHAAGTITAGTLNQYIGVALETVASGAQVDVLLQAFLWAT